MDCKATFEPVAGSVFQDTAYGKYYVFESGTTTTADRVLYSSPALMSGNLEFYQFNGFDNNFTALEIVTANRQPVDATVSLSCYITELD